MTKISQINFMIMLVIAIVFNKLLASDIAINEGDAAYSWGFIIGRATMSVLLPLFLVWLFRLPFHRKNPFGAKAISIWWILYIGLGWSSYIGSTIPASA